MAALLHRADTKSERHRPANSAECSERPADAQQRLRELAAALAYGALALRRCVLERVLVRLIAASRISPRAASMRSSSRRSVRAAPRMG